MIATPLSGHRILEDVAILHDDDEVFGRVLKELDVREWIAINNEQVSKGAFFKQTYAPQ